MDADQSSPLRMSPTQMASLVDAALRCLHPLCFLDSAVMTFKVLGRNEDATATAWMGCLLAEGEIEALLNLRATWKRGQARSPADAARQVAKSHC